MENPNASVNLRRHNSLPASRAAAARPRFFHRKNHLPNAKSNPYVGWFRHSPPITSLRKICQAATTTEARATTTGGTSRFASTKQQDQLAGSSKNSQYYSSYAAQAHYKTSPYVGWFRHDPAPFSSWSSSSSSTAFWLARSLEQELSLWLSSSIPTPDGNGLLRLTDLLSGHLAGGKPSSFKSSSSAVANTSSSSLTGLLLRRVANWIQGGGEGTSQNKRKKGVNPYFYDPPRKALGKASLLLDEDSSASCECSFSSDDSDASSSEDEDSSSIGNRSDSSDDDRSCDSIDPVTLARSSQMERRRRSSSVSSCSSSMMVSSQAEAYYAHATVTQKTAQIVSSSSSYHHLPTAANAGVLQDCNVYETTANNDGSSNSDLQQQQQQGSTTGLGRLDYEISQMDIVRMTRNASRHLDVESIVKLPTMTYRAPTTPSPPPAPTAEKKQPPPPLASSSIHQDSSIITPRASAVEEWSWMLVHEKEGATDGSTVTAAKDDEQKTNQVNDKDDQGTEAPSISPEAAKPESSSSSPSQEDDVCVICLEHFVEGDRLRVLPCDHSFHVGCIDQWLSGAASFVECYTAGCPTCKKQPYLQQQQQQQQQHQQQQQEGTLVDSANLFLWQQQQQRGHESATSLDGSMPSWAFARIGNALARESSRHDG